MVRCWNESIEQPKRWQTAGKERLMPDTVIQKKTEKLKAFIESLPDFEFVEPPIPYGHMGAVITDAMLQAGLNWESVVKPRVEMVKGYPQACTMSGFRDLLHRMGPSAVLDWEHPEKLARIAGVVDFFCACGIETEENLRQWLECVANVVRLKGLRGVGDKTADYFKFLVGIPTTAVDRHINNFLALPGIHTSSYNEAKEIVHRAAHLMGINRTILDHSIWKYMSSKGRKTKRPGCKASGRATMTKIKAHDQSVTLSHAFADARISLYRRSRCEMKKNPMDRPSERGEKTGPCPKCGFPEVVARKSRKTGELYFGCARPKQGPFRGCNFKGCRSH